MIGNEAQQTHIRDLAERLDTHRKRQQAQHPKLTLTGMYNVLEKLRSAAALNPNLNLNPPSSPEAAEDGVRLGVRLRLREEAALTATEREIHEHGLISVLRQLHDDLDASRGLRLRPPARRQARILADGRYVAA